MNFLPRRIRLVLTLVAASNLAGCRASTEDRADLRSAPSSKRLEDADKSMQASASEARLVADAFLTDIVHGNRHAAYLKMSASFRSGTTEGQFGVVMEGMERRFGRLIAAEYRSIGEGTSFSLAGVTKVWTLWYAADTQTDAKDAHYAKIEVVPDPQPSVQTFQIGLFANGQGPASR